MIKNGFSSIFVRVFYNNLELTDQVERMSYVMDEEDDDLLDITIQTRDRHAADRPEFQEGAELHVIWGYIKGDTAEKRKVWIREAKASYKTEIIEIVLTCTEKATELKSSTDNAVYKNKNFAQVVKDKADKHGLKAEIETDDIDINLKVELKRDKYGFTNETLDEVLKRETAIKIQKQFDEQQKLASTPEGRKKLSVQLHETLASATWTKEIEEKKQMKEEYQKTYRDSRGNPMPLSDAQLDMMYKAKKMVEAMGVMKSSPQANKSDKAYLNDLGSREKSGPYMVESRDDRLIIKRRDFNQPPYRSYEYGGPTGELLDFTPESKTRTKAGASNAMGFGGWNPLSKTAFNGVADGDGDPVLAKWTNALKFYKAQVEKGYGDAILTPEKRVTVDRRTFGSVPKQKTADNTGRATPYNSPTVKDNAYQSNDLLRAGVMQYDIRVKDHVKALEAAIKDRTETKDLRTRQLYNALGINPEEAFNQANGLRKNSELNRNPASATVWGDPNIKTGMIITFLGVGKKHAGNYYVKRVTHTVDRSSGYITDMEFVRQGSNIQTPEAKSQAKGNQKVNNVVGPTKSQQHAKSLKTITNGGNKKG